LNLRDFIPAGWPALDDLAARGTVLRMFLRSIRARLRPEDFGISTGRRRRNRGLRQEDVAKLAGVSPRWYEAFERGRLRRRFSTAFVTRIAETLRLDPHERASLFRLALSEVAETVEYFERRAQHKEHPAAPHDGV
jgi:transcriptional regulator with XRE-family HTH domain